MLQAAATPRCSNLCGIVAAISAANRLMCMSIGDMFVFWQTIPALMCTAGCAHWVADQALSEQMARVGGTCAQQTPEWCLQLSLPAVAAAGAHMCSNQPSHGLPAHHEDCACGVALPHLTRKRLTVIHLQSRRWAVSKGSASTAIPWSAGHSLCPKTKHVACSKAPRLSNVNIKLYRPTTWE